MHNLNQHNPQNCHSFITLQLEAGCFKWQFHYFAYFGSCSANFKTQPSRCYNDTWWLPVVFGGPQLYVVVPGGPHVYIVVPGGL